MNALLLTVCTCLVFSVGGQTSIEFNDINNTLSDNHINIPGSRIYMVPPQGFVAATSFMGFQKGNQSGLVIYDLIGYNHFAESTKDISTGIFKNQSTIIEEKEFKLNCFPAKYIKLEGTDNENMINLLFGDTTFSVIIMAVYPASDNKTENEVQQALKTIYYDKSLRIDPFALSSFTLDDSQSEFKFAKSASGIFIYTLGGVTRELLEYEPLVSVQTYSQMESMTVKSISEMLINKMKEMDFISKTFVEHAQLVNVNNYEAYEIDAYVTIDGAQAIYYQLVVASGNTTVGIMGIIKSDYDKQLEEIKKLARAIKLK